MGLEENMEKAREIIANYLFWHKSVGLSGLSKGGKLSHKTITAIRYRDEDTLSNNDVKRLIKGLTYVRNLSDKSLDAMIEDLEKLDNGS